MSLLVRLLVSPPLSLFAALAPLRGFASSLAGRWRAWLLALSLACAASAVAAQPAPLASQPASAPAAARAQRQIERARLEQQRRQIDRDYAAERAACMGRFLVFSCLDHAAQRHRRLRDAVRARQQRLDLLDREQRASEQRAAIRRRLAEHAGGDATQVLLQRQQRQQQAQREQRQRAQARAASAPAPARRVPGHGARAVLPGPQQAPGLRTSASQAQAARASQRERMLDYLRLQQRVRQQQQSPPAPPLPVPPASGPLPVPR